MPQWLKNKVEKPQLSGGDEVGTKVAEMLRTIREGGEAAALKYAKQLDNFAGGTDEVVVKAAEFEAAEARLPESVKEDIRTAHKAIKSFAEAQRATQTDLRMESPVYPGMVVGHRMVPVDCAGCYAPGGRFAHTASVIMTVATARAAGVPKVVLCCPPRQDTGRIHDGMLFAAKVAGADYVLTMGGVQGLASMAFGLFTGGGRANVLVGPGNRFVVAAKTQLFGELGIDLVAGPTEVCVLADDSADAELVTTDLVGQAEHGFDSPAQCITTSRRLAEEVLALMPKKLAELQAAEPQTAAPVSWRDYGEVILCESREEMCTVSDEYASEHLQVQCRRDELGWYHDRLRNYGSLFIGEETNVSYGDKASGPNHVLPTRGAGKYTGGLNVGCFLKRLSFQQILDPKAASQLGEVTARISRLEGMEGHARSADVRLKKYLPDTFASLTLTVPEGTGAKNTDLGKIIAENAAQRSKL
jgi:sulfopropanediol 3-dehydrogenase